MSTAALHWYVPYEKLDARQKDFVDTYRKNSTESVFLQGPPGSGKTILVVNLINQLRAHNPGKQIGLVTYTRSLIDMLNTGLSSGMGVKAVTYHQFMKGHGHYDILVVDEVQDLPSNVLQKIRSSATQIIVAGDGNQRIYRDGADEATIMTALGLTAAGQQFKIAVSYRLTPSVFRAARVFKPQVVNAQESTGKTDVKPELARAQSESQEIEYIYKRARLGPQKGEISAVLLPTHKDIISFADGVLSYEGKPAWSYEEDNWNKPDFGSLNAHLLRNGVAMEVVQNSYGSLETIAANKRIVLQTYHSAKGLDYNNVYMPYLRSGRYIDGFAPDTLFYVALTRSRAVLCLSYTGTPHEYLKRIESHCASIEANPARVQAAGTTINFGDDF